MFSCLLYPLSWSNRFCSGRGSKGSLAANVKGPWQKNVILIFSISQLFPSTKHFRSYNERKDTKKRRRSNMNKIPNTVIFWTYIKKKSARPLFATRSLLLVHVRCTPRQRPKGFQNAYFRNRTMGKHHLTWDDVVAQQPQSDRAYTTRRKGILAGGKEKRLDETVKMGG